jgi:hypothetical protein
MQFQIADMLAYRGLAGVQQLSRLGKASVLEDGGKYA